MLFASEGTYCIQCHFEFSSVLLSSGQHRSGMWNLLLFGCSTNSRVLRIKAGTVRRSWGGCKLLELMVTRGTIKALCSHGMHAKCYSLKIN